MLQIKCSSNYKLSIREFCNERIEKIVEKIIKDVNEKGDEAIVNYTRKFDCIDFGKEDIKLQNREVRIESNMEKLIEKMSERIEKFAIKQLRSLKNSVKLNHCSQILVPVEKVGVYVPSGKAPLFSSLLMTAIPARVAGVKEIYLTTPPDKNKNVSPYILFSAKFAGIKEIFRVGGAQAIAAMAIGTETIPRVDIVAGAGNIYVQTAKRLLFGKVGVDTLAGPSEIVVLADDESDPEFIACDLIAQAEHGEDSFAILLTSSLFLAKKVRNLVLNIIKNSPRKEMIEKALKKKSCIVIVKDLEEAIYFINNIAPEHLSIQTRDAKKILGFIRNAGAIFLGAHSPVAIGDYWAGPSHVIPTNGTSRFLSHLSVRTFLKEIPVISFPKNELFKSAEDVSALAEKEGLFFHAKSITVRKENEFK